MPKPPKPAPSPGPRRPQPIALSGALTLNHILPPPDANGGPPLTRDYFDERINQVLALLETIHGMEVTQMATQQEILDEVTSENTIVDSVLVLVQQLVAEQNPAARQAILDGLKANRAKLEAALLAGTPQAP